MPAWLHNTVGLTGTGLIVAAYALLQFERISAANPWYSVMNALGALLILFSLLFEFNLAAFLMEAFWLLISVYGLYRANQARRQGLPHG